jgi:predicted metal-dependent phosphoesterase TrpH
MKDSMQAMAGFIDMHVHSHFSDGTMSPEAILKRARRNHVEYLAVADHNILEGSKRLMQLADKYGVHVCSGVELDALENDQNIHILGYGMALDNRDFETFVRENRAKLDDISDQLIRKMVQMQVNDRVSLKDYREFSYDRNGGGWKALHYFMAIGMTATLHEGIALYDTYACSYSQVSFPTVATVCERIHAAGGIAVLAHPGVTLSEEMLPAFLQQMLNSDIDGIECYYPKHSAEVTAMCSAFCRTHGLYMTSGSDCHGGFGRTDVGEMAMPAAELALQWLFEA